MFERSLSSPRSAMALPFRPVDVPAQARALKLELRGREDGAAQLPNSNADEFALAEQDVITAIHADRDRCLGDLVSHLRAERDALAHMQTAMDVAEMRHEADKAKANFAELEARYGTMQNALTRHAQAADLEFNEFRSKNKLTRLARQPKDVSFAVALIGLMIVVEGMLNAWFFASGSDEGLLGGVLLAAAFSAVNVGVATLTGFLPCRWVNHRNLAIKLMGLLLSCGLMTSSVGLNFFVAHYRDASQISPDLEPLRMAISSLLQHPFSLQTIQSWLLLAVGIIFAGFAIWKGYHLDDPYPGYGAADRRRAHAVADDEEMRQEALEVASEVRDTLTDHFQVKIESLRGSSAQRKQILAARARNILDFVAHEENLALSAQQLLSIYRRANQSSRSTSVPPHFNKKFSFPDHALDRPSLRSLMEDIGLEIDAEGLVRELDTLRREVLSMYEVVVRRPTPGASA